MTDGGRRWLPTRQAVDPSEPHPQPTPPISAFGKVSRSCCAVILVVIGLVVLLFVLTIVDMLLNGVDIVFLARV